MWNSLLQVELEGGYWLMDDSVVFRKSEEFGRERTVVVWFGCL